MLSKQTASSLIRAIIMILGAFLINHHIGSTAIDQTWLDAAGGIAISLFSVVWGMFDKSTSLEAFEAAIKQALVFVGGLLVTSGKISIDSLNGYIGILTVILPVVWSYVSKKKTLQAGK